MREIAYYQIESLKRRMDANPQLKKMYNEEIKKIIDLEKELEKRD